MTINLVVTRHDALVEYARELGLVGPDLRVLAHVSEADVAGQHVLGVLPLHLAALAASVTEIPLALEPADRGVELPIERVRAIAGDPVRYVVRTA